MNIRIVDFVTMIAALASTAGLLATTIRYVQRKDRDPKVIGGTIAGILLILIVGVLITRTTTITVNNTSTIQLGAATQTATPTVTPTLRAPSVALPTEQPSYSTLPQLKSGIYNENIQLSCGGCDSSFLVTITKARVDMSHDEMTLTFAYYNHSGNQCRIPALVPLQLTDPTGAKFTLTGPPADPPSTLVDPGKSTSLDGVVGFVARSGAAYTVTASVESYLCNGDSLGPQTISF